MGCVNPQTGQVTVQSHEKGNAKTFKKFLKKVLLNYQGKQITMVLDNVRYHHAKMLKPFLERNKNRINLLFLPAYSPDLNPIERVWWFMRKKITHNRYVSSLNERLIKFWMLFSQFQKPNEEIKRICNINHSV
jgi:transposase